MSRGDFGFSQSDTNSGNSGLGLGGLSAGLGEDNDSDTDTDTGNGNAVDEYGGMDQAISHALGMQDQAEHDEAIEQGLGGSFDIGRSNNPLLSPDPLTDTDAPDPSTSPAAPATPTTALNTSAVDRARARLARARQQRPGSTFLTSNLDMSLPAFTTGPSLLGMQWSSGGYKGPKQNKLVKNLLGQ
jgi:hypothetical protein